MIVGGMDQLFVNSIRIAVILSQPVSDDEHYANMPFSIFCINILGSMHIFLWLDR